jgi:hypothetical protein
MVVVCGILVSLKKIKDTKEIQTGLITQNLVDIDLWDFKLSIMKKLIILTVVAALLVSCNRSFTPERAAMTGGKTCKDRHRIR